MMKRCLTLIDMTDYRMQDLCLLGKERTLSVAKKETDFDRTTQITLE
jgi:hypothetical protein